MKQYDDTLNQQETALINEFIHRLTFEQVLQCMYRAGDKGEQSKDRTYATIQALYTLQKIINGEPLNRYYEEEK